MKSKNIEETYRRQLENLISSEVIRRVEKEGGITPLGPLFTAAVLELQGEQKILETEATRVQTHSWSEQSVQHKETGVNLKLLLVA